MAVLARRPAGVAPLGTDTTGWHLAWFVAISGVAFFVPFTLTSLLDVNHHLYYLVYFAITLALLMAYVSASGISVAQVFLARWRLSLAVGAVSTVFVVWNVLARTDSTAHPGGAYFAFEIMWRGGVYGVVDALLLSAFPGLIALGLMDRNIAGLARRAGYAVLTLVLVLIVTAAYHLGYGAYRNSDVREPMLGNTMISLPVLLSANPAGSVIAHTSMHLSAVTHSYETDVFLPPQTSAD